MSALDHVRADWELIRPDLHWDPAAALEQLTHITARIPPCQLTLIGSSLGGFYAWLLAERLGCRAVLLNPSLAPFETLKAHLGPQRNLYTDESFDFTTTHLDSLKAIAAKTVTDPQRYFLIVEMGDALLDHHVSCATFIGAKQIVVDGGDHALASFPNHLPAVLKFCGLGGQDRD